MISIVDYSGLKAAGHGPFLTKKFLSAGGQRAVAFATAFCPGCGGQCLVDSDLVCPVCDSNGALVIRLPED